MKGQKDSRGDRISQRSSGGASSSILESGALFPRVHVKETKTTGPRAPPRNKMALYEQFTFPSHRFVPPSISVPAPAPWRPAPSSTVTFGRQQKTFDGSTFCSPPTSYSGMPWMPYSAMNTGSHPGGQVSVNASSGSTGVDYEGEFRQTPVVPGRDTPWASSNGGGAGSTWTSSDSNVRSSSSKKAAYMDVCTVPKCSSPSASNPVPIVLAVDQLSWQPWQPQTLQTSDKRQPAANSNCQVVSLRPATASRDEGKNDSSGTREDTWSSRRNWREGDTEKHGEEQSEQQESGAILVEKSQFELHKRKAVQYDSHVQKTQHRSHERQRSKRGMHREVKSDTAFVRSRLTDVDDCVVISDDQGNNGLKKGNSGLKAGRRSDNMPSSESPASYTEKECNENAGKRATGTDEAFTVRECPPSECKSSSFTRNDDDMEDITSGTRICEPELSDLWSDGEESDAGMENSASSARNATRIMPRDIIKTIGELEFWKARELLQRQQAIFSAQVFELHRLIKVQQLLATCPHPLIGEVDFGDFEKVELTAAADMQRNGSPEVVKIVDNEVQRTELHEAEPLDTETRDTETQDSEPRYADPQDAEPQEPECPVSNHVISKRDGDEQPDSPCHSTSPLKVGLDAPIVDPKPVSANAGPLMPVPIPGIPSPIAPWGCPPFPNACVNPWFGAMLGPNGTYMYPPPYPGPYGPNPNMATFNGQFCPIMCAPGPMDVPQMTPYGLPSYEHRPDLVQNMLRYNTYQSQLQNAAFQPPAPAHLGTGWYGIPPMPQVPPMLYMDPQTNGSFGWYDEMRPGLHPTGSQPGPAPHQNSAQFVPLPIAKNGQLTGCAPDSVQIQVLRSAPMEPSTSSAPPSEVALASSLQTSSGATVFSAENDGWQVERHVCQDGDADVAGDVSGSQEISTPGQNVPAERSGNISARSSTRSEATASWQIEWNTQGQPRNSFTERESNPLPLFPLVPALASAEKGVLPSPFSGVIKSVPRAIGATAESAAEILLSIQKQRKK